MALTGLAACSKDDQASPSSPSSSSGAASSGAAASGAAQASGTPASAGARPAAGGKTFHIQRTQGDCTFDLDAPEELKESEKDGMSFTLESESFAFTGYDGTTLHSKPAHALDMFEGQYKDIYRGTENGVHLAIVTSVKGDKPATDKHAISGMGGEPYASGRSLGCTFSCDGVKAREADVVAMCKSVRIKVKPEQNP